MGDLKRRISTPSSGMAVSKPIAAFKYYRSLKSTGRNAVLCVIGDAGCRTKKQTLSTKDVADVSASGRICKLQPQLSGVKRPSCDRHPEVRGTDGGTVHGH